MSSLWAWGLGAQGRLGTGNTTSRSSPVQVGSLTTWDWVSTGNRNTQAIRGGLMFSWGYGDVGAVGDGSTTTRSSPVAVGSLNTWAKVSAGYNFSLAVKTDGTLWGWGDNSSGNLGVSNTTGRSSPQQIGSLTTWATPLAGGYNLPALAIKTDGTLWSWGGGANGVLGSGAITSRSSPVQVGSLTNWAALDTGSAAAGAGENARHIIARKTDGTLWAWGAGNYGQLGQISSNGNRSSPVQIGSLTTWTSVAAGTNHSAAVKSDGTLWAWGRNQSGQLGQGDTANRSSPVQVGSLTNWSSVEAGSDNTFAVKTDGTIWAWGTGGSGVLGDNTTVAKSSPVQIGSLTTWTSISAGNAQTFGLQNPPIVRKVYIIS